MPSLTTLRRQLAAKRQERAGHLQAAKILAGQITKLTAAIRRKAARRVLWHPNATRTVGESLGAGSLNAGTGNKLVWHTTEGSSAAGAIRAYQATRSWPTLTFDPTTGELHQHMPLNEAARALEHPPGGVETNRARCVQVELVGFADATFARKVGHPEKAVVNWGAAEYARIADLARWIERNAQVKRRCGVTFLGTGQTPHLSDAAWLAYEGHCGHQHVPGNHHWDPGKLDIGRVLA